MDNVFIERLWCSVKHEGVYLWAHENVRESEVALEKWLFDYNYWKPHQVLGYKTPWECYRPLVGCGIYSGLCGWETLMESRCAAFPA